MQLKVRAREGAIEIIPAGSLTIENATQFEEQFQAELTKSKEPVVGLSFVNVAHVDSSGIGSLIKLLEELRNHNRELKLFGLNPAIQKIFETTQVKSFFTIMAKVDFESLYPSTEDKEIDDLLDSI